MKVAVAVHGRFHAFELAARLHRAGLLAQLATTYPAFAARRFLPPGIKLATAPGLEAIRRIHAVVRVGPSSDVFIARAFGRFSVRHLPDAALTRVASGFTWDDYGRRAVAILRQWLARREDSPEEE